MGLSPGRVLREAGTRGASAARTPMILCLSLNAFCNVKRDLRKAEEEEEWRENTNNRDQWKQITKVVAPRSDQ